MADALGRAALCPLQTDPSKMAVYPPTKEAPMAKKRYDTIWRNKFLTIEAKSIDDMINILRGAAEQLAAMAKDGVKLDPNGGTEDDYACLYTNDPKTAKKHGLEKNEPF